MKKLPIASSKLSPLSWITLLMGVAVMLMIQLMIAVVYPFIGIPILLLSLWWFIKQPSKVHFFEEEIEVTYFPRKTRMLLYEQIEYLRFTVHQKTGPALSLKIAGEKKKIVFEYGTRENLAKIFNLFRSRNIRIKDEGAQSRSFVELVEGVYQVKSPKYRIF